MRQDKILPHAIELELFRHLLVSIAEEMGAVLRKTSYSANIKERRDYSCAVYDAGGDTVAMGDHMPVHLGAMPLSVAPRCDAFDLQPGDVAILNDPFRGGTHLAGHHRGRPASSWGRRSAPAFYVANRAHHADVGGMSPGSMPLAREIYQEGFAFRRSCWRGADASTGAARLILANVRTPEEREGDLLAQLMAIGAANTRLLEIIAKYGHARVATQHGAAAGL